MKKYFDIKATSRSDLVEFKKSPQHYMHYQINGGEQKPHYLFGNALHTLVLEPDKFEKDVIVFNDDDRPEPNKTYGSTLNKEWKQNLYTQANEKGIAIINKAEHEQILRMRDALYASPPARELLMFTRNKYEQIDQWTYKGEKCKSMKDISNDEFIADLKGMVDAGPDQFNRNVFYYNYWIQGGMYMDGDSHGHMGYSPKKDFYFICVEKEPPHGVAVYRMTKEYLIAGMEEYRRLIEMLQICRETGEWPSYDFWSMDRGIFNLQTHYSLR